MFEQKIISGLQMKKILKLCGFSLADYAKFIKKSRSYVSNDLGNSKIIPLRYFDKLQEFLGSDNLEIAMFNIDLSDPRDDQIANLEGRIKTLLRENSDLVGELNQCKEAYHNLHSEYQRLSRIVNMSK